MMNLVEYRFTVLGSLRCCCFVCSGSLFSVVGGKSMEGRTYGPKTAKPKKSIKFTPTVSSSIHRYRYAQSNPSLNKNQTANMIIPVRCFTCGKVIGNKWETYLSLLQADFSEGYVTYSLSEACVELDSELLRRRE